MTVGSTLRGGVRPALEAVGAMGVTVGVLALMREPPGAMLLGAVLAMVASRSRLNGSWRGRAGAVVVLPAIGIAVEGVGILLFDVPALGAVAYTLAMVLSVWLRRFGSTSSCIGGMIALPFVTLLVGGGVASGIGFAGVLLVSLLALVAAVAVRLIGGGSVRDAEPATAVQEPSRLRPMPSTRMAVQLGVATAIAFVIGFAFFGEHWGWAVLTAYLVLSGNRGRADVLLTSGLRVLAGAAGVLVVAFVVGHIEVGGPWLVVACILVVGAGLVALAVSYAWWALAVTIVLSVIQSALTGIAMDPWPRVVAIVVGALVAAASAWFVLPVRSIGVLRRRIADLLRALADRAAGENVNLDILVARLDEVAPAFLAVRWSSRWGEPARWVSALRVTIALLPEGRAPAPVRRSIAAARAAIRDHDDLTAALERLGEAVAESSRRRDGPVRRGAIE